MKRSVPHSLAAILIVGALLHLGGMVLKGPSADPDQLMSWTTVAGTFLIFAFWVLAVLGWGRLICRRFLSASEEEPYLICALGTLGASALMMILGFVGCIHPSDAPIAIVLLYLGLIGGWWSQWPAVRGPRFPFWGWALLPAALLAGAAVIYGARLGTLSNYTDPLYYHLLAPRYWSQAGRILFFPDHPLLLQSTTWEMLYLWPCVLLGGPGAEGLIEIQYFAQWTHFFLGWGSALLALWAFLSEFETDRPALWTALLAAMICPGMIFFIPIANNDWGVALWEIAGLAVVLRETMRPAFHPRRWVAAGLLLGWGLAGKFTTAFFVAPALAALILVNLSLRRGKRKFPARLALFTGGIAAGLAPTLARNAVFTGNPFFPALDQWFRTPWIPLSLRSYLSLYEGGLQHPSLASLWTRTHSLLAANPLVAFVPVIPLIRRVAAPRRILALALTVFWIGFGLLNRGAENRLSGAGIVLLQALGILSAFWLLELNRRTRVFRTGLAVAGCAWIAWNWLGPELRNWPDFPRVSPAIAIRTQIMGGEGRAWLRMNVQPEELVLTTGDGLFFLTPGLRMVNVRYSAQWAAILDPLDTAEEMVAAMRARSARYLFDTDMTWDPGAVWGRESYLFQQLIARYPEALVYVGPACRIIDLERLEESLSRSCVYQSRRVTVPG